MTNGGVTPVFEFVSPADVVIVPTASVGPPGPQGPPGTAEPVSGMDFVLLLENGLV